MSSTRRRRRRGRTVGLLVALSTKVHDRRAAAGRAHQRGNTVVVGARSVGEDLGAHVN